MRGSGLGGLGGMQDLTKQDGIELYRPLLGVPKKALIYEGEKVRLWVAHEDDKSIELRNVETGLINGDLVEVKTNLKAGEKIVTKGSLFIDRAASGT